MPALLRLEEVSKRFGGLVANDRISLEVQEGEILGLIGPNGAGKTTLFHCISGFYTPDGGRIFLRGQEITGKSPEEIAQHGIARTFQIVRIFKDLTVLDNTIVGALLRTRSVQEAKKKAVQILEFTGLKDKMDRLAAHLTIADKKRLELSRALATDPVLLLLDETMAGLNPQEIKEAVDLIRAIRERGITVFVVEHVMEAIMTVCDRIIVLDYGRKIADDVPANIATNEEVIKAYLGERYHVAG
ncbi:MAG: ABC transporter ATP-binding protein [Armatimonadota bacterium]|nr:ABC transporter ATP-binding protein [Armatimonadota bacterium]MDR5703659.1 ABC transporter ATP-binding protein [Armatimonadota bacterium]MDR7434635.1 ABC transporter ATP-binding protein [Armatimonadota bacterium]